MSKYVPYIPDYLSAKSFAFYLINLSSSNTLLRLLYPQLGQPESFSVNHNDNATYLIFISVLHFDLQAGSNVVGSKS